MISLSYDLHIHSCLSPCGDNDMTPANIVQMSALKGLDVIAITDHNSCKNSKAVAVMAKQFGITALYGMELCTQEEVHVICLFTTVDAAMDFDSFVSKKIIPIKNNVNIFGNQHIYNEYDEILGEEEILLISATTIPFDDVYSLVNQYEGIMIPAHIDKNSNSLISNLGFVPEDAKFRTVELKEMRNLHELQFKNPYLNQCKIISNSDAHYLEHINEPVNYLYAEENSPIGVFRALSRL